MKDAPVVVLWGDSDFLLLEGARRAAGAGATEVDGEDWAGGLTADLATPSLLGERRAAIVRGFQDAPAEALEEVARYALDPHPDARLVLTVRVSARAKGPPVRVTKQLQGRAAIERVALDRKALPSWIGRRAKDRGVPVTEAGARTLVDTLGEDPAVLDQAVAQIATAFPEEGLTPGSVASQFRGLGEHRIWDLCDAAFTGDGRTALRVVTAMLASREEPLAILGGVAARLRDLIRVASAPRRASPAEVAKAAGLRFDWQAKRYLQQARGYPAEVLAGLHARVVEADRALKLGGRGDVVLPMLISRIASVRA